MKYILILITLLNISCINNKKEILTYEKLEQLIKKNKINSINFSIYELNKEFNGYTLLDKFVEKNYSYEYAENYNVDEEDDKRYSLFYFYKNKTVFDKLKANGAKTLKEINKQYKRMTLLNKIKYELKYNTKYKGVILHIGNKNLDEILKSIIFRREYELIELYFDNNYNFNKVFKMKYSTGREIKSKSGEIYKENEERNVSFLDLILERQNKEMIKKFKKHGAKRACEILKVKCEKIIFQRAL